MAIRKSDRRASARRVEYIIIEGVSPEVDGGRYPAKRVVGDVVSVGADVIKEGSDKLVAWVLYKAPGDDDWSASPMTYDLATDRWYGAFVAGQAGRWTMTIEAATDRFATWRADLEKKVEAGADVVAELLDGAQLARTAAKSTRFGPSRASLLITAAVLEDRRNTAIQTRIQRALDDDFLMLMQEHLRPSDLTRYPQDVTIVVDRQAACLGAWYDMSQRSRSPVGDRPDIVGDAAARMARVAELGFDVVQLTPPPRPAPDALDAFNAVVESAHAAGMEIALDYALRCAPDDPWVSEHPDWFCRGGHWSVDRGGRGSPPAVDEYSLNLWCDDRERLWHACRDVLLSWVGRGVRLFSVSEPQTAAFAFWVWVIAQVRHSHPDVLFVAAGATRPKRMRSLAKLGFTISYTYFPWKNEGWDLRCYLEELTQTEMVEYYHGLLFPTVPEAPSEYLALGGLPALRARLLLAATLSPLYGIHGGDELDDDVRQLNSIRRSQPALRHYANLSFHSSENPAILFYRKAARKPAVQWVGCRAVEVPLSIVEALDLDRAGGGDLLIAVNMNPHRAEETMVHVPLSELGLSDNEPYVVHDLLTDARYTWRGARNYVRLDPAHQSGHLLLVERN